MKTWLITGCSSGFGQRLALAAAQRGDQVIATARNIQMIEEMAEPFGGRMITLPLDVTDVAAAKAAVATAVETFGGFDVLVNNAGYALFGAIEEGTPEEYRPMFEVNVKPPEPLFLSCDVREGRSSTCRPVRASRAAAAEVITTPPNSPWKGFPKRSRASLSRSAFAC